MIYVLFDAYISFGFSHIARYVGIADGWRRLGIAGKPFWLSALRSPCTTVDLNTKQISASKSHITHVKPIVDTYLLKCKGKEKRGKSAEIRGELQKKHGTFPEKHGGNTIFRGKTRYE